MIFIKLRGRQQVWKTEQIENCIDSLSPNLGPNLWTWRPTSSRRRRCTSWTWGSRRRAIHSSRMNIMTSRRRRATCHWLPELDAKNFGNKWLHGALLRDHFLFFREFRLADTLSLIQDEDSVSGECNSFYLVLLWHLRYRPQKCLSSRFRHRLFSLLHRNLKLKQVNCAFSSYSFLK